MIEETETIVEATPAEVPGAGSEANSKEVKTEVHVDDPDGTGDKASEVETKIAALDEAEKDATELLDTDEAKGTVKQAVIAAKEVTQAGGQPTQVADAAEHHLAGGPPAPAEEGE